jgi:hypothetical protein
MTGAAGPTGPKIDGARDGDGTWFAGRWYPDQPVDHGWKVRYHEMQQLLMEVVAAAPEDNHAMQFQARARNLLNCAGKPLETPKGPAVRAEAHAEFLESLALAYRLASGVAQEPGVKTQAARNLLVDALRAWERGDQGP